MICWKYWPRSPWYRHTKLGKHAGSDVLRKYYGTDLPPPSLAINKTGFAVLDLETTGLNPASDHILSIGVVHIDHFAIGLESAWHEHVYTPRPVPEQSAVIHHITDDTVSQGSQIDDIMPRLLERLEGRILIAHHARLETGFLKKICQKLYQQDLVIPVIDTEKLASRRLRRTETSVQPNALRLFNLRKQYNLPEYKAHNALSDAIATAELFLAQASSQCPDLNCALKRFITG